MFTVGVSYDTPTIMEIINQKTMEKENNNSIWGKILKIVITVLTAVATTFGLQACGFIGPF